MRVHPRRCYSRPVLYQQTLLCKVGWYHPRNIISRWNYPCWHAPHVNKKVPIGSSANWDAMKEDTKPSSAKFVVDAASKSVKGKWSCLVDHIKVIQSKHIPTKLSRSRHDVPWRTGEVGKLCRKRCRLYRKTKKASAVQAHKDTYKTIHNETRTTLEKAHWSYVNSILLGGLEHGDTKPFYNYIKSQKRDNQGV